jgi:hypothetical protein
MKECIANNKDGFLLTYKQCAERYNIGTSAVMKLARASGAIRFIGKTARVLPSILDKYILDNEHLPGTKNDTERDDDE